MDEHKPNDFQDNPNLPVDNQNPPAQVPKPPEDTGHVGEHAATDTRTPAQSGEPIAPPSQPEHPEARGPVPTVAELDKSHEKDLDKPANEPTVEEKPAVNKANAPKKGSSAILAVVIALLVTLLLVGIGFAAWQASKSSETNQQNTEDTSQQTDEGLDTTDADEIEQDLQQIESDLDQLETDLDESSLEDEEIGL